MSYLRMESASLDAIFKANNKMTIDELREFNSKAISSVPSPMWHLNSKQRKSILKSIKDERIAVSHGWPLDGVGI